MDRNGDKGRTAVLEKSPCDSKRIREAYEDNPLEAAPGWTYPYHEDGLHRLAHSDSFGGTGGCACLRIDEVTPQELGAEGERIAANYLADRGWVITERNWSCPYGEADIIAYDDQDCVFVEVKTRLVRSERERVYPELAVDEAKRRRYVRMAEYYMAQKGIPKVRFDVIAIVVVARRMAKLHHVLDAFGSER